MEYKDSTLLNISTYTNYIVHNSLREVIELKTEVKVLGKLLNKSRYAILTTQRLLLFENREKYLNKKKPTKQYTIIDHDFQVNSNRLQILSNSKIVFIELSYPSSELAIVRISYLYIVYYSIGGSQLMSSKQLSIKLKSVE